MARLHLRNNVGLFSKRGIVLMNSLREIDKAVVNTFFERGLIILICTDNAGKEIKALANFT